MRIVVAGTGSRGDMQPLLALGRALVARGHSVDLCGPPDFAQWAAELDLVYHPMGGSFERIVRDLQVLAERRPLTAIRSTAGHDLVRAQFEVIPDVARKADVLVGNLALPAGPSIARACGIPCYLAAFQPNLFADPRFPPAVVAGQHYPRWLNRLFWAVFYGMFDLTFKEPLNAGRRKLGIPPVRSVIDHVGGEAHLLVAVDPAVTGPLPDWPLPHTVTGYWFHDDSTPLPADLEAFLAAGEPPAYIGFGSMTCPDPVGRTRLLVAAAEEAKVRAVISAGWAGLGQGRDLPASCLAIGPVSHTTLFPRCQAIVHHGGSGTTAAAARSGRPQVVVPHVLDQHFWSFRIREQGLGPAPVPVRRLTVPRLAAALGEACGNPEMARRAAATGELLRARDGLAEAIATIEAGGPPHLDRVKDC